MADLLSLPSELKHQICFFLQPTDCFAVRLVCKRLVPFANERVFTRVVIRNGVGNPGARGVFANEGLRKHVREVVYLSDKASSWSKHEEQHRLDMIPNRHIVFLDSTGKDDPNPPPEDEWPYPEERINTTGPMGRPLHLSFSEWEEADGIATCIRRAHNRVISQLIEQLSTLPRLERFAVVFHPRSFGQSAEQRRREAAPTDSSFNPGVEPGYQWHDERFFILRECFQALAKVPSLKHLELYNYVDENNHHITRSHEFKAVLGRLETLEIYFAKYDAVRLRWRFLHTWLWSCMENVKRLVIMGKNYWGYMPCAPLRVLHFPKLRELELGAWMLSQKWEIDWLTSHGKTLRKLAMINCPILIADMDRAEWLELNPDGPEPWECGCHARPQDAVLKWKDIYAELRSKLINLTGFYLGGIDVINKDIDFEEDLDGRLEPSNKKLAEWKVLYRSGIHLLDEPYRERPRVGPWFGDLYPVPNDQDEEPLRFHVFIEGYRSTVRPIGTLYPENWRELEDVRRIEEEAGHFSEEDLIALEQFVHVVKSRANESANR